MRRAALPVLLLSLSLAACGSGGSSGTPDVPAAADSAVDATPLDVTVEDAPTPLDASDVSAPLDAPDAPVGADAQADAPAPTDAPHDAPAPADVATDLPLEDAPVTPDVADAGGSAPDSATDASSCPSPQTRCGAQCIDTRVDPANCGACAIACPAGGANTAPVCRAGSCEVQCATGFADCDGDRANGCETPSGFARVCGGASTCVDVRSSVTHCGACNAACAITASNGHALARCADARCVLVCESGYADCDGNLANGCEADLTSITHCGSCGNGCMAPVGTNPVCRAGVCGTVCQANRGDCDGNTANGCETNVATSTTNCGSCGTVCAPTTNAMPTCRDGVCVRDVCSAGYANCNGNPADGCEAQLSTDRLNCGACGTICATPLGFMNGNMTCRTGACDASCNTGWGDCDGNLANGCETDLQNTRTHCGACGRVCGAGLDCVRGFCIS